MKKMEKKKKNEKNNRNDCIKYTILLTLKENQRKLLQTNEIV